MVPRAPDKTRTRTLDIRRQADEPLQIHATPADIGQEMIEAGLSTLSDSATPAAELDAALDALEPEVYLSTVGIAERAAELEAQALAVGLISRARRASLLRSDVLSRRGELEAALRLQLEVLREAEASSDRLICARAQRMLASTYERLVDVTQSQAAAEAAVNLLAPGDPPTWHAEHMMVLAVFTTSRRLGAPDFSTFEEAARLARRAESPILLGAVLNNYAWTALEFSDELGVKLAIELRELIGTELQGRGPSPWLDTVAVAFLKSGRLDDAASAAAEAVARAPETREPSALPGCMLTLAEIERVRGNLDEAERQLLEARRLALAAQAPEFAALALKGLSELAALSGDFEEGYKLLRQHLDEWARFQDEKSDARAATLQAIWGAEVERRRRLEVEQLADTDPLTGLWNRRYLERRLSELSGTPVALALVDLDHFKEVNDRFSHDAGDAALRRVSELLKLHVEFATHAFAVRLGGEEFVLVLPATDTQSAVQLCERVRAHVQATDWSPVARGLRMSASVGLAVDREGTVPRSQLLSRADAALYEAKRRGRNRVVDHADLSGS
jgi:diguanylate cyclase (GGDEF)-like protein